MTKITFVAAEKILTLVAENLADRRSLVPGDSGVNDAYAALEVRQSRGTASVVTTDSVEAAEELLHSTAEVAETYRTAAEDTDNDHTSRLRAYAALRSANAAVAAIRTAMDAAEEKADTNRPIILITNAPEQYDYGYVTTIEALPFYTRDGMNAGQQWRTIRVPSEAQARTTTDRNASGLYLTLPLTEESRSMMRAVSYRTVTVQLPGKAGEALSLDDAANMYPDAKHIRVKCEKAGSGWRWLVTSDMETAMVLNDDADSRSQGAAHGWDVQDPGWASACKVAADRLEAAITRARKAEDR